MSQNPDDIHRATEPGYFSRYTFYQEDDEEQGSNASNHKEEANNDERQTQKSSSSQIRKQATAFLAMARVYFEESAHGRWLFFGLILLMILNSAVRVLFSFLARDFWSALGNQDVDEFYRIMRQFLIALVFLAPINVFYRFQQQRLGVKWRKWMTHRMLKLYYSNQVYYKLERSSKEEEQEAEENDGNSSSTATATTTVDKKLDNPDQRIAEDVKSFTQFSLSLFLTMAVSLIDLVCFSIILYSIEPKLFLSIIAFALVGTIATVVIGKKLVQLNFERLQKEADFRYSLVRIRENAESIAFFRGEQIEGQQVRSRFAHVISNAYDLIGTQRNLDFFTTSYNYLTWILPVVAIAPEYFAGNVELGVIQQASAAFGHVLDDLSIIIDNFESLSEFSASIDRLYQFMRAVQRADPDRDHESPLMGVSSSAETDGLLKPKFNSRTASKVEFTSISSSKRHQTIELRQIPLVGPLSIGQLSSNENAGVALSIRQLCLLTPDLERTLIHSLNLELKWGESLLIVGPSGVGKSSLLRAIAGLWSSGSGVIERANTMDVYFLPQRPYCPLGSLRDQLLYPSSNILTDDTTADLDSTNNPSKTNDRQILRILESVDLLGLAGRAGNGDPVHGLDRVMDWSNTLSLGEQQRLAFGRILVNQPRLVIMDESTSAMDVAAETRMYDLLKGLGDSMTYISVGHRPTLLAHHDTRLHLNNTGTNCSLGPITSTEATVSAEEVNLLFK